MKTNIVLLGFDLSYLNIFATKLAKTLDFSFVDANKLNEVNLLNNIDIPLALDTVYSENKESSLLNELSNKEKVVISLPVDMFIANDNYKMFKNSFIIFLKNKQKDNDLIKNIEQFLEKKVNLVLNQENIKFNELIAEIKE